MNMKSALVCLLLLSGALPAESQKLGTLVVIVSDPEGKPVAGAEVSVTELNAQPTLTDSRGKATITRLKPDWYTVIVAGTPFPEWTGDRIRVEPGMQTGLLVQLGTRPFDSFVTYDGITDFEKEWYGEHLKAMKEPFFCSGPSDPTLHEYRFLWLRTFHNPVLVGIRVEKNGTGRLRLKITSGHGGYEPGYLKTNKQRVIPKEEVESLIAVLNEKEMDFWSMPTRSSDPSLIGSDGAQWILEGVKDGRCHFVDRWSPDGGVFKHIGLRFLIDLAKLKLLYYDVY